MLCARGALGLVPVAATAAFVRLRRVRRPVTDAPTSARPHSSLAVPRRTFHAPRAPPAHRSSDASPASSAPTLDAVAEEVAAHVPSTFTSLQQISRELPPTLREAIAAGSCGGLLSLLSRYGDRFETKRIGQVYVARSRAECRRLHSSSPPRSSLAPRTPSPSPSQAAGQRAADAELQSIFPCYLVPVKSLWETASPADVPNTRRRVLDALRAAHSHASPLAFFPHPCYCGSTHGSLSGSGALAHEEDSVLEHGYVQLQETGDDLVSGDADDTAAATLSPDQRLAGQRVRPYEWYRVARLLPSVLSDVQLTAELQEEAALLLPKGRALWHVLCSAPRLFRLRYEPAVPADSTGKGRGAISTTAPSSPRVLDATASATPPPARVYARFLLDTRFVPPGVGGADEAALLRELDALATDRGSSRCGLSTRQRRQKRRLQRQLAYLRCPTPYFDERVVAQYLFDLLPLQGGMHQAALIGSLPQPAVQALPPNVTELLEGRADLFQLVDVGQGGKLVQRADAVATVQRSVDSVTAEEVLQHLFAMYSVHSDPREGTTLSRNLPRLPRLMRERLFAMQDVVAEMLCLFPDKVELLAEAESHHGAGGAVDERAVRELQTVRGRRDFLVPFRFVGEWQDKLADRHARHVEKEMAKRPRGQRGGAWGNQWRPPGAAPMR